MKRVDMQVWFDCDPGFDDWFVWLLLEHAPNLLLQGVQLSYGNADLAQIERNASSIANLHGFNTPLYRGASEALLGSTVTAQAILGSRGMTSTGLSLESPEQVAPRSLQRVSKAITGTKLPPIDWSQTTWLATGPLTNLALAMQQGNRPSRVVWMGGSTDRGNHTPAAEFNAFADPEAAAQVFASGIDILMIGLNVCREIVITQLDLEPFRTLTSLASRTFTSYLDGYQRIRAKDGSAPMPLYDPVALAALLHPEWFTIEAVRIDVECSGAFTRGMTVCDFKRRDGRKPNAQVATGVQAQQVKKWLLSSALEALGE